MVQLNTWSKCSKQHVIRTYPGYKLVRNGEKTILKKFLDKVTLCTVPESYFLKSLSYPLGKISHSILSSDDP